VILGAILAGGRARRFGGDKALASLNGRPLIAHVLEALAPAVDRVVVCGRSYGTLHYLADMPGPDFGPLGGINAALAYASAQGWSRVVTFPCDTPHISPILIARLIACERATILTECPVIGSWPSALADRLADYLANRTDWSVRGWARSAAAEELDLPPPHNVNFRADLDALQS
jgi:molybdopterin-guanine dinucleotide biosynthesis protein A